MSASHSSRTLACTASVLCQKRKLECQRPSKSDDPFSRDTYNRIGSGRLSIKPYWNGSIQNLDEIKNSDADPIPFGLLVQQVKWSVPVFIFCRHYGVMFVHILFIFLIGWGDCYIHISLCACSM